MNFICVELIGAPYQPQNIMFLDDFWVVPACKNSSVLELSDLKLFLVFQEGNVWEEKVRSFIFCYQFLFLKSSIYYCASLLCSWPHYVENGISIDEVACKIHKKYGMGGACTMDFAKIESFHTDIEGVVDFSAFYIQFVTRYISNVSSRYIPNVESRVVRARDVVDLFLYTVGSEPRFYNNLLQKVSQLQTIFEALIGKPEQVKGACGLSHNKDDWKPFITEKLKERGINNEEDVQLILRIKTFLNSKARVPYVHGAEQLNTWCKTLTESITGTHFSGVSPYETDFRTIFQRKVDDWAAIDWESVYFLYQRIIKGLIYLDFLES